MQFNSFIWGLYRDSKDGKAAIERNLSEHIKSDPANWFSKAFIHNIYYCEVANGEVVENGVSGFEEVNLRELIKEFAEDQPITDIDSAEEFFTVIADEYVVWEHEKQGKNFERVFGGGRDNPACYADIFGSIEWRVSRITRCSPGVFCSVFFCATL